MPPQRFSQLLKWIANRKPGFWPKFIPSEAAPKPPASVGGEELRATFVNHSTVLLQTQGRNILTDPIWSQRAGPTSFLGPKRRRDPGVLFEDLPKIDAVLISHNHYDHFDVGTLRKLLARDRPEVFCPLGVARLLKNVGFRQIHELDWWQEQTWSGMKIHCVPAQHFSSRTPFDRDRTLWCGWVLEDGAGQIYFAGDTGFGAHFSAIGARFPFIRLALLPIGAFRPEWFMGPVHMTPEEAVKAHSVVRSATSIAIHFGTFALADDGEKEPADRLKEALKHTEESRFWVLKEGEGRSIPALTSERLGSVPV
jgi:L-ascorbate metabolism protein UlaG (beta-lactamase superfamily)